MRETPDGRPRTERDLREALVTLEQYAPDAETVLRAVRDHSRPRRTGSAHATPWLRRPRLILPLGVAAVAAALAVALLPGAGLVNSGRAQRLVSAGLPNPKSVAKAMLTAVNGVSGDVEYATQTGIRKGVTLDVYRNWSWPAQPTLGQRQTDRTLFSERRSGTPSSPLEVIEDTEMVFVTPPVTVSSTTGQTTMVCYREVPPSGCGDGNLDTPSGTWSRFSGLVPTQTDTGAGGMFNPALLARGIADGAWKIVRRTQLQGQQAIELTETGHGAYPYLFDPMPTLLWVNAQSYLPIRMTNGTASTGISVSDFSFLPATPANLALLKAPIPAGYPRSTPKS